MIGQTKLLENLNILIKGDKFPRVILLVGQDGSGKRLIAEHIAKELCSILYVTKDISVATMRDIIIDANTRSSNVIYLIPNIDNMSVNAENSLLKLLEETPKDNRFILTASDSDRVLPTILSRVFKFCLYPYSTDELYQYCRLKNVNNSSAEKAVSICSNPGEIDTFLNLDMANFTSLLSLSVSSLGTVSTANALKLVNKISEDTDTFNLRLFLKAYMKDVFKTYSDKPLLCHYLILYTSDFLSKLSNKSISRPMLCTMWILNVRKVYDDTRG